MKNTYKWRASNVKYLYITDVNGVGPFIYNKLDGTKTFLTYISTTNVDETLIKDYTSKLGVDDYFALFAQMIRLSQMDVDCAKIEFADAAYYYNTDGDECVESPPPVPCQCFIPKWEVNSIAVDSDYDGKLAEITKIDVISATKEIIYSLNLYIPKGTPGETSEPGPQGPQGETGADGKNAQIVSVQVLNVETGDTPDVIVTTGGTTNELELYFKYILPKGEKGDVGEQGEAGENGIDAYITSVTISEINAVESDAQPEAFITTSTTYNELTNQNETSIDLSFNIPRGEKGDQGPMGLPAEICGVTINSVTFVDDTQEDPPGASAYCKPVSVTEQLSDGTTTTKEKYELIFDFKLPKGKDGDVGPRGNSGEKGDTDWIYIDKDGGTDSGDGGDTYVDGGFYQFGNVYFGEVRKEQDPNAIGSFNIAAVGNSYLVTMNLDRDIIGGGGAIYCPGSGITFTEPEEDTNEYCTKINANTEATTVNEIICSTEAPVDALGIWENDVIPSGTTIQEILEKIFCREKFPNKPTTPTVSLSGNKNLGVFVIGDTVPEIPAVTIKPVDGKFNADYDSPKQPEPQIAWSNYEITVSSTGFTNHGLTDVQDKQTVEASTTGKIILGTNKIEYKGSANYGAIDTDTTQDYPLTNLGNPTLSTLGININPDEGDTSAIWKPGIATKIVYTTAIGVYPCFYNLDTKTNSLCNDVIYQLPPVSGNTIEILNVPPEASLNGNVYFKFDFPKGKNIKTVYVWDSASKKYDISNSNTYMVDKTNNFKHTINGVEYEYWRLSKNKDYEAIEKFKIIFDTNLEQ